MASRTRTLVGLVMGLTVAVSGGLGVRAIAGSAKELAGPAPVDRPAVDGGFRVVAVRGQARALSVSGAWRPVQKDDVVARPSGIDVAAGDTLVSLISSDITLNASHGARATFNAAGLPLAVYLERGRVWVQSARDNVKLVVERHNTTVTGRSFGAWSRDGKLMVSAVAREIVVQRGERQNTYSPGTEVVIGLDGVHTRALPTELSIDLDGARKDGARWTVSGRTSPVAVVMGLSQGAYQEVSVSGEGRFTATLAEQVPGQRELIAFDSAGREAQVGQRSQPLESKGGRRRPVDEEPVDAAPPPDAPSASPQVERSRPIEERTRPAAARPAAARPRKERAARSNQPANEDDISLDEPAPSKTAHRSQKIDLGGKAPPPQGTPSKAEAPAPPKKDDDELNLEW